MKRYLKLLLLVLGILSAQAQPVVAQSLTKQPTAKRVSCVKESDIAHIPVDTTTQIDEPLLRKILQCAATHKLILFELFDELIVLLKESKRRIVIPGDMLRSLSKNYEFGGLRMKYLFAVQLIDQVECGAPLEGLPQLEIYLNNPPPDYIEKVNWVGKTTVKINKHYGCAKVEIEKYEQCFGMTAVTKIHTGTVTRIIPYEEAKIAIYIKDFFRPKRWEMGRIAKK